MEEVAGINDMVATVTASGAADTVVVEVKHKGVPAAVVKFYPEFTDVRLEKKYTNWSKSIVKTAKIAAGVK